ncbi:MAG TPA: LysM domain-containing protein [Euzebyales bacterium]|nr:LysM domain-containing protein [Euzebyales bacterium]
MSDEPEFTDEPYRGTQILWGRVVVLLLALALAFWLGTTFGGDDSAQGQLEDQRAEIARLESQVAALEAEAAAVDAGGADEGDDEARDPRPSEPAEDDENNEDDEGSGDGDGGDGDEEQTEAAEDRSETTPANAEGDGTEYVVQSGDSLAAIAQEVYGDPTLWREIARANDLDEPYSLTVGDTLDIPAQP